MTKASVFKPQTYVSPGNLGWTRIAGCHGCGWETEDLERMKAYRMAEQHECEVRA